MWLFTLLTGVHLVRWMEKILQVQWPSKKVNYSYLLVSCCIAYDRIDTEDRGRSFMLSPRSTSLLDMVMMSMAIGLGIMRITKSSANRMWYSTKKKTYKDCEREHEKAVEL